MTDSDTQHPNVSDPKGSDLRVCGEDVLISRSLGKLESGRFSLQTLRRELTAIETSGGDIDPRRVGVLIGLANSALGSLNDLAWRLQLRKRGASHRMVGSLAIADEASLKASAGDADLDQDILESMSKEMLVAKYRELSLRRRILAEEFNTMSDHAIALQRSRFYRWGRKFGPSSAKRIDTMVNIACALEMDET